MMPASYPGQPARGGCWKINLLSMSSCCNSKGAKNLILLTPSLASRRSCYSLIPSKVRSRQNGSINGYLLKRTRWGALIYTAGGGRIAKEGERIKRERERERERKIATKNEKREWKKGGGGKVIRFETKTKEARLKLEEKITRAIGPPRSTSSDLLGRFTYICWQHVWQTVSVSFFFFFFSPRNHPASFSLSLSSSLTGCLFFPGWIAG